MSFPNAKKTITRRKALLRQRGCVVWLTGLSGSGKSTLATTLQQWLLRRGHLASVLDGDDLRRGLNADLGYSRADRNENIRRAAEVARILADCGVICIAAFISPFRAAREKARRIIGAKRFLEVYVATDLAACERRDVKGWYRKARRGRVTHFTGIHQKYEPPARPLLTLDTTKCTVRDGARALVELLETRGFLTKRLRRLR